MYERRRGRRVRSKDSPLCKRQLKKVAPLPGTGPVTTKVYCLVRAVFTGGMEHWAHAPCWCRAPFAIRYRFRHEMGLLEDLRARIDRSGCTTCATLTGAIIKASGAENAVQDCQTKCRPFSTIRSAAASTTRHSHPKFPANILTLFEPQTKSFY